ncbi:hypothetical protein [Aquabacterium sp.]|uniref:hypothetical protein n=1 Tax=Aquabacterium sp. TaxID=1872578 RepID=UPI0040382E17
MSMQKTIEELIQCGQTCGPATAFLNCLTLLGKIDEADALKGLSERERAILNALLKRPPESDVAHTEFVLSMRPHGRMAVWPAAQHDLHAKALAAVSRFALPDAEQRAIEQAAQDDARTLEAGLGELEAFFETEGYQAVAQRVEQAVKNMAPLIFQIGDECFSNFYNVGRGDVPWEYEIQATMRQLHDLQAQAPIAVQTLACCLDLLLRSGTYTRAEEMNSCQLNIQSLKTHFLGVFDRYRYVSSKNCIDPVEFTALPLKAQASMLANLRIERQELGVFVRDINGLNLLKKERYFKDASDQPALAAQERQAEARQLVESIISQIVGHEFEWTEDTIFQLACVDGGVFAAHPFDSGVEYLIDAIIKASLEATQSDVGMSRGTRNIANFTAAWLRQDTASACEWTQAEYYCHAVASPPLQAALSPKKMCGLINAVSSRMRYNTWHYAPSYFKQADIPEARGWFHAPRMADIAEWSDHHHAGHVHAAVRYSIRSPAPIVIHGQALPGLTDLRLMRQAGRRYTLGDLALAIKYTDALRFVCQKLADVVTQGRLDFEFKFGSKSWIDGYYTSLANESPLIAA